MQQTGSSRCSTFDTKRRMAGTLLDTAATFKVRFCVSSCPLRGVEQCDSSITLVAPQSDTHTTGSLRRKDSKRKKQRESR